MSQDVLTGAGRFRGCFAAAGFCLFLASTTGAALDANPPPQEEPPELREIVITAPEPRYVAPTQRDRIGRIWAPVYIDGKGPFRMALDTGSQRSTIRSEVVAAIGRVADESAGIRIRGVTGTAIVPSVQVASMVVGDMELRGQRLPVIKDPLGGADGILGTEGLGDKRIYIDFVNDFISIRLSRSEPAPEGFITLPFTIEPVNLPVLEARLGRIPVRAIISTGGSVTLGNLAARDALLRQRRQEATRDTITDVTESEQVGEGYRTPALILGDAIRISTQRMTFGDLQVFEHWKLTDEPAVLIGMDALGLLDTLIIDYRRAEMQVLMRSGSPRALF